MLKLAYNELFLEKRVLHRIGKHVDWSSGSTVVTSRKNYSKFILKNSSGYFSALKNSGVPENESGEMGPMVMNG